MNMLAVALLGFGVKMLIQPKTAVPTQPLRRIEPPLPTLKPAITEGECASRGGIWTGTECLGAKSAEQVQAEVIAKRERMMIAARERATAESEHLRYTEQLKPTTREGMFRRTVLM